MRKPVILIVDDEHANQFLLEGLLNAHGYDTLTASDGEECMEILKTNLPDLILLDIMMPRMTGVEVLKLLIHSDKLKHIPVLMVSAKTTTADIKESLEIGAIDYIKVKGAKKALVNPVLCKGDGLCNVKCPTGAIELKHFTNKELLNQIEAVA